MFWFGINPNGDRAKMFFSTEMESGETEYACVNRLALEVAYAIAEPHLIKTMLKLIHAAELNDLNTHEQADKWLNHPASLTQRACAEIIRNIVPQGLEDGTCKGFVEIPNDTAIRLLQKSNAANGDDDASIASFF